MNTKQLYRIRKLLAERLMIWHTKGDRITCYYYDKDDRRTMTIRNWWPDWKFNGQIWWVIDEMAKLGYLMKMHNDKDNWLVIFKNEHRECSGVHSDPCLAILMAVMTTLGLSWK